MIPSLLKLKHIPAAFSICIALLLLTSAVVQANDDTKEASYKARMDAAISMLQSDEIQSVSDFVDSQLHQDTLAGFGGDGRKRYIGYLTDIKLFHHSFTLQSFEPIVPERNEFRAKLRSLNTELDYGLTLELSEHAPYKVVDIYFSSPRLTPQKNSLKLTKQELVSQLSTYVDRLAARGAFSGAVLLADKNGVLYQNAKGMADLRYQVKNNPDTKFNLASMNKMFTAVSVLQLVVEQKLALDDKLVKYVDRSLFAEGDFDNISIAQLLTHTSGLGWPNYPDTHQNNLRHLNDHRPFLKHLRLNSQPGTQFSYSNEGMLLLGMVIEAVSGMSYDDYVQKNIYQKAGMTNSGNFDIDGVTPNMAMGYFYSQELQSMQSNWFIHAIKGNAAGGGYSTISDLHKFSTALTSYKLLPEVFTRAAYSAKPELNSPYYGYGFSVRSGQKGSVIGHSGAFIGVSSEMRIYLEQGYTLIVLANQGFASEPVITVADSLIKAL